MQAAEGCPARLHLFLLTFKDARTEREFTRHIRDGFFDLNFKYNTTVFVFVSALSLFVLGFEWKDGFNLGGDCPNHGIDRAVVVSSILLVTFVNAVASRLRCIHEKLETVPLEMIWVPSSLLNLCFMMLGSPPYLCLIKGHPMPSSSDADLLLLLVGQILIVHLNPHVRWHTLIPVQVCSILCYSLPTFLLEVLPTHRRTAVYTLELAGIVLFASQSKRISEYHQRLNFLHVITERTRRVSSEFQLSRLEQQAGEANHPSDTQSVPESVPTTTATGRAFNLSDENGPQQLDGIRAIGRREQWLVETVELSWRPDAILGVGGFGLVVEGQFQETKVALKMPKVVLGSSPSQSHLLSLCNELQILRRLRHPNIIGMFGAWLSDSGHDIALVMEFTEGVTLKAFVAGDPDSERRAQVLSDVSCALLYLHTRYPRVIHGDLKGTNIFVETYDQDPTRPYVAKLLDFGLARRITKNAKGMGGSLRWMAPEILQGVAKPTTAADVFSVGRVIYFVVSGEPHGSSATRAELIRSMRSGDSQPFVWPAGELAGDYQQLVARCDAVDPAARPVMSQVHQHLVRVRERHASHPAAPRQFYTMDMEAELSELRDAAKVWSRPAAAAHQPQALQAPAGDGQPQSMEAAAKQPSARSGVTSCRSWTTRTQTRALLYPEYKPTPADTQELLILAVLTKCNVDVDQSRCCWFHAGLRGLQQATDALSLRSCVDGAVPPARGQCQHCLAVLTVDDVSTSGSPPTGMECGVCGEMVPLGGRPMPSGGTQQIDTHSGVGSE